MNQAAVHVSSRNIYWQGIKDCLPLSVAVIPWGILCGSLAIEIGLTIWQAQFMSLLIFGGAVQLASLNLIAGGAGLTSLFTSSAVITSRHLLYSAALRLHVSQLPRRWRISLAFLLTDEMFALVMAYQKKFASFSPHYALASGFTFYLFWNIATLVGIIAGSQIENLTELGLDFAIAAMFIAMVLPHIESLASVICIVVSGVMSLLFIAMDIQNGLLYAGLIGMTCGYLVDQPKAKPASTVKGDPS